MQRLTVLTTTYKSARYLQRYFEGVMSLANLGLIQVILIMNAPEPEEAEVAHAYEGRYPALFRLVEVEHRETIGASFNRGFALANTPYISLLDVDDVRVSDSYDRQMATLDANPDADFTYGDFMAINPDGSERGYFSQPEFYRIEFIRYCYASPTQLFRKSMLNKVGGWDEQFRTAGDFEFQARAAMSCKFKKTAGLILYYTYQSFNGSSSKSRLSLVESAAIQLRYGGYDRIATYRYHPYVADARHYRLDQMLSDGKWLPIQRYLPGYRQMMGEREAARKAFERAFVFGLIRDELYLRYRSVRGKARQLFSSLGLLLKMRTSSYG